MNHIIRDPYGLCADGVTRNSTMANYLLVKKTGNQLIKSELFQKGGENTWYGLEILAEA